MVLRVLSGMSVWSLTHLLQMVSSGAILLGVTCIPPSEASGDVSTRNSKFQFWCQNGILIPFFFFFLSLQLRTPKICSRICRNSQQEPAGNFQVRDITSDPSAFPRFPGCASLTCLVFPTELWSSPTCSSPAKSGSGAAPSDRGAGGHRIIGSDSDSSIRGPNLLHQEARPASTTGECSDSLPTGDTRKTEELKRK